MKSFLNNDIAKVVMSMITRSDFSLIVAVVIIVFAIVITSLVESSNDKSFSQIITVGPVWTADTWSCTSTTNFIVHGTLISYDSPAELTIHISDKGTQPDFEFFPLDMHSFTVGGNADSVVNISRTGNISGFITMQTSAGATASCTQI